MADTPAQQAAAGVVDDFLAFAGEEEQVSQDPPSVTNPGVPTAAGNLLGDALRDGAFDYDPTGATEAEAEVEQPQDEVEVPEISWDTPEDLKELLEAPDFDEEEEVEEFEGEGNVAPTFEDEYEDPEKEKLRKQLAKAQKKLAWAEEQKVKASRKSWEAEARKYFQFSNPDLIEAKSRRAFLKQAQAQHQAVAKVAKPVFDQIADLKQKAREEALAEARAEAERRWGAPTTGPQAAANLQTTQQLQRERLMQGKNLKDVVKAKLLKGEVNL